METASGGVGEHEEALNGDGAGDEEGDASEVEEDPLQCFASGKEGTATPGVPGAGGGGDGEKDG